MKPIMISGDRYDDANRIAVVNKDDVGQTMLQAFQYGSTNARLMDTDYGTGNTRMFASVGGTTLAEYHENYQTPLTWIKTYTYLGDTQLSTITPNGTGGEYVEFNHPDRLGTKVITNQAGGTAYEQTHLPFGTALNAESTGSTNNRFTSYDRSAPTGLDYALNRTYDPKQGRFTQVDPIGMQAVDFQTPQTLNLYSYAANDPINHLDPDGLFWGAIGGFFKKLFKGIAKYFKFIMVAVAVATAIVAILAIPATAPLWFKILGYVGALANATSSAFTAAGMKTIGDVFGIIGAAASFGLSFYQKVGDVVSRITEWTTKAILSSVSAAATLTSRILSAVGHRTAAGIFGLGASITGFISAGYKGQTDAQRRAQGFSLTKETSWSRSPLEWLKFLRDSGERIAALSGAHKVAAYLGIAGLVEDGFELTNLLKSKLPDNQSYYDPVVKKHFLSWRISRVGIRIQQSLLILNHSNRRVNTFLSAIR